MKRASVGALMVAALLAATCASPWVATAAPIVRGASTPAPSASPTGTQTPDAEGEAGAEDGVFILLGDQSNDGTQTPADGADSSTTTTSTVSTGPIGHWVRSTACDTVGAGGCLVSYSCEDGSAPVVWTFVLEAGGFGGSYSQCPEDPEPTLTTPVVDIPGEALKEFKKVKLPESTITVQPPGGETLVNFKTILSTQAERHQVDVHLEEVNLNLVLEVWPSHFLWHHGDGTTQESTIAGLRWTEGADVDGEGFITHIYTQTLKAAQVSVDTTWSAQFKVAGDPDWRPVNGTVTKVGDPVPLTVREAKPELVTEPN